MKLAKAVIDRRIPRTNLSAPPSDMPGNNTQKAASPDKHKLSWWLVSSKQAPCDERE